MVSESNICLFSSLKLILILLLSSNLSGLNNIVLTDVSLEALHIKYSLYLFIYIVQLYSVKIHKGLQ